MLFTVSVVDTIVRYVVQIDPFCNAVARKSIIQLTQNYLGILICKMYSTQLMAFKSSCVRYVR